MAVLDTGTADAVYQAYRTGENEAEVVVLLTDQVNSFLDRVTFGRVMGPLDDDVQGKVDQCANELLAFLIRERVEPEAQSETVGGLEPDLCPCQPVHATPGDVPDRLPLAGWDRPDVLRGVAMYHQTVTLYHKSYDGDVTAWARHVLKGVHLSLSDGETVSATGVVARGAPR